MAKGKVTEDSQLATLSCTLLCPDILRGRVISEIHSVPEIKSLTSLTYS